MVTDLDTQHEGLKGSFLVVFLLLDNEMVTVQYVDYTTFI